MLRDGLRLRIPEIVISDPKNLMPRRSGARGKSRETPVMDWKQKLQSAREAGQSNLANTTNVVIEEHWPKIQRLFQEKVGPAALATVNNDQAMRTLLQGVYMALPFPVRMVVNEGMFINFCLENRVRLLPQSGAATIAI
jgi:hypothetical protein